MPVVPAAIAPQSSRERIRAAIERVESGGDDYAISPSGGHFGRYQMGHARAADVGISNARVLLGNEPLATWAFFKSLERSERWHNWNPILVAISWKAGTGSLKQYLDRIRNGMDAETSLHRIPWNTAEYVRRFKEAYR